MAPKLHFETGVYAVFFDLAKLAREVVDPMGGKLMSHVVWMDYVKDIVAGDLELGRLVNENVWLGREVDEIDVLAAQNLSELLQVRAKSRQRDTALEQLMAGCLHHLDHVPTQT